MSQRNQCRLASWLATGLLVLGLVGGAVAQVGAPPGPPPHHPPEGPMGPGPMPFLGRLQLSDSQEEQVFRIFHEQAPAMHERTNAVRRARAEIEKVVRAADFDRARLRELADAEGKALAELAFMRAEAMRRVRELLTPEQRAKLDQAQDSRRDGGRR